MLILKPTYINSFIFYIFLWVLDNSSFTKVSIRNRAVIDAQRAYLQGNFSDATLQFQFLAKQTFFTPPEVTLNLANSLFEENNIPASRRKYAQLVSLKGGHQHDFGGCDIEHFRHAQVGACW